MKDLITIMQIRNTACRKRSYHDLRNCDDHHKSKEDGENCKKMKKHLNLSRLMSEPLLETSKMKRCLHRTELIPGKGIWDSFKEMLRSKL
jgi:hypothetical protein